MLLLVQHCVLLFVIVLVQHVVLLPFCDMLLVQNVVLRFVLLLVQHFVLLLVLFAVRNSSFGMSALCTNLGLRLKMVQSLCYFRFKIL